MPEKLTDDQLRELIDLGAKATARPWTNGPQTLAGQVWVYSRGDPLAEPASPRDWFGIRAKACALFKMRSDDFCIGDLGDARWKRQEANADFIAASANAASDLAAEVIELRAALRRYGNHREDCDSFNCCHNDDGELQSRPCDCGFEEALRAE